MANNTIKNYFVNHTKNQLEQIAYVLAPYILDKIDASETMNVDSLITKEFKNILPRVSIMTPQGKVIADNEEDAETMENHLTRPEIKKALSKEIGSSIRYSATLQSEMLYVAVPIIREGKIKIVIRTSYFLNDFYVLLTDLRKNISQVFIVITLLSLLVGYFISKKITRPLQELTKAHYRVSSGDFSTQVVINTNDEIELLSSSFNTMSEEIKKLLEEVKEQKDFLNNVITSIYEPLFIIDKNNKIVLYNENFKKIIKDDHIRDKHYWEIIRDPVLENIIDSEDNIVSHEIALNNKTYLCSKNEIPEISVRIITFNDISELKRIEKIKKDFVTNVSHELRTPLTAIKGFIETLEETADSTQLKYIEIIKRHTERLINLGKDILTLSHIEAEIEQTPMNKVDLKKLLGNISDLFDNRLKEKNIELYHHFDDDDIFIYGDEYRLEEVFINLIDNAVKYTDKGKIDIRCHKIGDRVEIAIEDTGIGISKEDLPRVFERFYTVDKSRSRKSGGTGLGLSIIKHIILQHKAKINIESELGKGTTFHIHFITTP